MKEQLCLLNLFLWCLHIPSLSGVWVLQDVFGLLCSLPGAQSCFAVYQPGKVTFFISACFWLESCF